MKVSQLTKWIKLLVGLPAFAAVAATVNGSAIDLSGQPECGTGAVLVDVGAATGTPTSFSWTVNLQESDDGSTGWATVTDATATGIATGQAKISFTPGERKRYIRVQRVVAFVDGTSPTLPMAILVALGDPKYGPLA